MTGGSLVALALVRELPYWFSVRRQGGKISYLNLLGVRLRRVPVGEFVELYTRLQCSGSIEAWIETNGGPHPLELVHMSGGRMSEAAEEWQKICVRTPDAPSFAEFCKTLSRKKSQPRRGQA